MDTTEYVALDRAGALPESPTLFLFHGTGGDEHQFIELGAELMPGARLVAPRGDVSEQGAARYFKRLGEGRYDMADFARATDKMAEFVGARVGLTRPAKVAGFGYSNGANILASVLFTAPERFDSAILAHPLIPFAPKPQPGLRGKRVLITAGKRDPIAPAASAEKLVDYFRAQGAEMTLFWHEGGHEIRREELLAAQEFLRG